VDDGESRYHAICGRGGNAGIKVCIMAFNAFNLWHSHVFKFKLFDICEILKINY
jgi:hypothetical protein